MKQQNKFNSEQQHEEQAHVEAQQQGALEFATVEDMLRHDALHTPVPPAIARRLQDTIGQAPPPPGGWWRRFFGS